MQISKGPVYAYLQAKKNASNRSTEGNRYTCSRRRRKDLTFPCLVAIEAVEGFHHDIGAAASNMHQGTFLAEPKTG